MRPDTRSFSFTWLRGQQHEQELSLGRPATRSQTAAAGAGILDMEHVNEDEERNGGVDEIGDTETTGYLRLDKEPVQGCSTGGLNLRKFGSTFLRNISNTNKYASMDKSETKDSNKAEKLCQVDIKEIGLTEETMSQISTGKTTSSIGRKINKTVQDVKNSLETFSQKFRRSTRKRYRMGALESLESGMSPTRKILGRTPTKLYSPFGFDSPIQKTPKRLGTERTRSSTPRLAKTQSKKSTMEVYSPGNRFKNDLKDVHRGLNDLRLASRGITRRSVRF